MSMLQLSHLMPEGYTGEIKQFQQRDVWPEIYAARQNGTILEAPAAGIEEHKLGEKTIPCLVVMLDHVKGLIPLELSDEKSRDGLRRLIGQNIVFKVIGIDRDNNLFIGSRKAAREHMANVNRSKIKPGAVVPAVVRRVLPYMAELDLGGISARLLPRDFSWGWVKDMRDHLQPGDNVEVKVTAVEGDEVYVSIRELLPDPWPNVPLKYNTGNEYLATVTGVVEYGVFCNLEPGVDSLAPHHKFIKVKPGDKVIVRLLDINMEKRHIRSKIVRLVSQRSK